MREIGRSAYSRAVGHGRTVGANGCACRATAAEPAKVAAGSGLGGGARLGPATPARRTQRGASLYPPAAASGPSPPRPPGGGGAGTTGGGEGSGPAGRR